MERILQWRRLSLGFLRMVRSTQRLILVRMRSHPYFEAYYNSLSVAGINGNFKNRFGQSPLIGVLSGKSGYISGVRAISGYMETSSENRVVFSLITNNYTMRTSEIDRIQQRILEAVYAQL